MFTRRNYLMGSALVGAAATLSACGLDNQSSPDSTDSAGGAVVPFTIYTARDSALAEQVIADFEKAKPEWAGKATMLTLGAQEALERVRAEKSNPQGDLWWGGTRQQLSQGASDGVLAAAPQAVIDAIPADYRDKDGLWIGEMLLAELFMINTEMISGTEIPADWDDLLDPRFKDKIIIRDVEASGTMRAIYCAMIDRLYDQGGSAQAGYDWLKKLDGNTRTYAANPTDMYQRISRQEGAISLWNLQDIMLQKNGDFTMFDAVVPASGAPMLVDGLAKIANGPGGAGADAFITYLMSAEVQTKLAEERFQIPTIDLENEPAWLGALGLKEMKVDWNRIAENEKEWIGHWAGNIKGKG